MRVPGRGVRRRLAAAAMVLMAGAPLSAQQRLDTLRRDSTARAQPMQALVVTVSRRAQRSSDAPVAATVISRAEIARSGAQDLHALLTQYVGVQPEPSEVGSGGVQIEGLSSEHVLLLIDGQPLVGRIDGELDLSRVPTQLIDHVEVISGPLSTLYGSSAMGGVINVITRPPGSGPAHLTINALGGSQGRRDLNGDITGGIGAVQGVLDLGRREDDVQPGRPDQSAARARRWDADGKLHWATAHGLAFDASWLGVREDQRWQSGQLYYFSNNLQTDGRLDASTPVGDAGKLVSTLYYSGFTHLSRQATLPEPVSDSGDQSDESLARAEVTYSAPVTATQVVDAGVDVDRDALLTDRILGSHRTSVTAEPYLQYTVHAGEVEVVPGARLSVSDQWGTHFTPKLALLLHLPAGWALRGSVATGYRAPDFKELYLTFLNATVGYVVDGNPDLQPETSVNVSGGADWTSTRAYLRLQGYVNHFSHFIESVEEPDSGGIEQFTYGNVARGITRGVDVDAGVVFGVFGADASYGYVYALDRSTALPLLGVTPQSARVALHADLPGKFQPSVTLLYWGPAPAAQTMVGFSTITTYRARFTRVDARVARAVTADLSAQVGVHNLFGARPADWPGVVARQWYAGLAVSHGF